MYFDNFAVALWLYLMFAAPLFHTLADAQRSGISYYANSTENPWGLEIQYSVEYDDRMSRFGSSFLISSSPSAESPDGNGEGLADPWKIYFRFPNYDQFVVDAGNTKIGYISASGTSEDARPWYVIEPASERFQLVQIEGSDRRVAKLVLRGMYYFGENPSPDSVILEINGSNGIVRSAFQLASGDDAHEVDATPSDQFMRLINLASTSSPNIIAGVVIPCISIIAAGIVGYSTWEHYFRSE